MLRIQKYDPPTLDRPSQWSREFNAFIAACLKKDASKRPEAGDLLQVSLTARPGSARPQDGLPVGARAPGPGGDIWHFVSLACRVIPVHCFIGLATRQPEGV